jgi:putative phage-type endonuclease
MKISAKKLFNTKNMSREEWLKARQLGIGGSDASGIVGLNRWASPLDVYISKVDPIVEDNQEVNRFLKWGTKLEPVIREDFKEQHPELKVQQSHIMWQHPEHEFMLANVDGFLYHKENGWGVLEIKTVSQFKSKEWDGENIPEEYLIQMQHYFAVTGLKWGYFAILIGGNDDRCWYIERDDELIEMLITMESNFWNNHVKKEVIPEIDGSAACSAILDKLHPPAEVPGDSVVELSEKASELLDQYESACEQEKAIIQIKDEAKNKLKFLIGDFETAVCNDRKITWKSTFKKTIDSKRLKKEAPEIFEKYVKESSYRTFKIY